MASEAERQAARIALNGGLSADERQKQINAVFAPYSDGGGMAAPPTPTPMPAPVAAPPPVADPAAPFMSPPPGQVTNAFTGQALPPAGGVTLPETTVAPRPAGGGVPGPGRPTAGPAPWLRNAVSPTGDLRGAPSEADLFNADFEQSLRDQGHGDMLPEQTPRTGEEIAAEAHRDPGLVPHTPGVPETPDEAQAANEIADDQFKAATGQAEAGEDATQQVLTEHKKQLDQQAAIDAENATRQADRFQHLEKAESNYRSLADAVQNEPIDSQRLWNNKSTGEKVLSKLAIFLGTLGSGLAGTPNAVWESMQSDIDRDIDAQKSNKALQQSRLAAEGSLFGMAKERFQDEAMADASMREAAYGRMARELEHFEQTARTPERKQAIAGLRAVAEEKYMAAQQARRMRTDAYVLEQERLRRLSMQGADPNAKLKAEAKKKGYQVQIAEGDAKINKADREIRGGGAGDPNYVPGSGQAPDAAAAKAVRESATATSKLESALDRLDEIQANATVHPGFTGANIGGVQVGTESNSRYRAEVGTARGLIGGSLANSGTLNAGEAPTYEGLLSTKAGRAQLRRIVREGHQNVVESNISGSPKKFRPATEATK